MHISKRLAIVLCLLVVICGVVIARAVFVYLSWNFQQEAIPALPDSYNMNIYINNTYAGSISSGSSVNSGTTFVWGSLLVGTASSTELDVGNGGASTTIILVVSGLPSGWTETWTANNTVTSTTNEWANGTMTLTIPSNTSVGQGFFWNSYVEEI
jgi:hypothetical protein